MQVKILLEPKAQESWPPSYVFDNVADLRYGDDFVTVKLSTGELYSFKQFNIRMVYQSS